MTTNNKNNNNTNNSTQTSTDIKNDKYIELNVFIKKIGLASTGGQAKTLIRSEKIMLNGTVETRNKKKLYENDIVEYENKKYTVHI
ncbi:MAG: RNA-binding S4 domain-containing protein [Candidatus Woesearchaeota archaeon]